MTGKKVVLTSDRTIMSSYYDGPILGLAGILPKDLIPGFAFSKFFCPPVDSLEDGRAKLAPCGMRRIEGALLENGFDQDEVAVVAPEQIQRFVGQETRIVGITHDDPLGKIAYHETEEMMGKGAPYNRFKFQDLLSHPSIKKYSPRIVLGGKGAWEVIGEMDRIGIDHVFIGEGDILAPVIFKKIIRGEEVPRVVLADSAPFNKIPLSRGATIGGIIEIARGCGRTCAFCLPTMQQIQSRLLEHILKDIETNLAYGQKHVLLCSEDALLYGGRGFNINKRAILELFAKIRAIEGIETIDIIHTSISTVYHNSDLIEKISEIVGVGTNQRYMSAWLGIETASPGLIARYMPGKAKPARPENWPEMVKSALRIFEDNGWISISSLILGLPKEEKCDVINTIELIDKIRRHKTFILPFFFSSIDQTGLQGAGSFKAENMTPEHWVLMGKCLEHNLMHMNELFDYYSERLHMNYGIKLGWKAILKISHRRLKKYARHMLEGESPFSLKRRDGYFQPADALRDGFQ